MSCIEYEPEGSTAYSRRRVISSTTMYYIKAIDDVMEVMKLLDVQQSHGKRRKKGKANKDWDK